jgi:uncharacterized membrane protein
MPLVAERFKDAHEERLTHRLESFSDVVIGFSLAQLSLNFAVPAHPADVYRDPRALSAFVVTFTILSATWYAHHWLFDRYFVPRGSTIVVNFATLASIVWLIYQLQLFIHFGSTPNDQFAAISYLVTFAVTWCLLGLLYALSVRLCWPMIPAEDRRTALYKTGRLVIIGVGTLLAIAAAIVLHLRIENVFWIIGVWALLWRLVSRRALRGVVSA